MGTAVTNCANPSAPSVFHPRLYAADSETQSVFRGEEEIKTSDSKFDQMTCSFTSEIARAEKELNELSWKCEKWKAQ